MWKTGGNASFITDLYWRFKSLPAKEHRVLPMMTPSVVNKVRWRYFNLIAFFTSVGSLRACIAGETFTENIASVIRPGFNIGTILNMNLSLSSAATSDSPVRKCKIPLMIQELGVSPGWTRALNTIWCFRLSSSYKKAMPNKRNQSDEKKAFLQYSVEKHN